MCTQPIFHLAVFLPTDCIMCSKSQPMILASDKHQAYPVSELTYRVTFGFFMNDCIEPVSKGGFSKGTNVFSTFFSVAYLAHFTLIQILGILNVNVCCLFLCLFVL